MAPAVVRGGDRAGDLSVISAAAGRERGLFGGRTAHPGGGYNDLVKANSLGYPLITWSIDTLDWKTKNAQTTYDTILSQVKDGDIILMHQGRTESALALREILAGLRQMGLQPGTVSDLMADAPLMSGPADKVIADLRVVGCVLDE